VKSFRPGFFLTVIATFLISPSCNQENVDVCGEKLPQLDQKLENAIAALQPWLTNQPGRYLASATDMMAEVDKKSWREWGQNVLVDVQRYADYIDSDSSLIHLKYQLSAVSNDLVSFVGYADSGNANKMVIVLARIREKTKRSEEMICN